MRRFQALIFVTVLLTCVGCDHVAKQIAQSALANSPGVSVAADTLRWSCGAAEALPFADRSFDTYTIAFGLRNVTDIAAALAEARRVLKPLGRFACLEFSQVQWPLLGAAYDRSFVQLCPGDLLVLYTDGITETLGPAEAANGDEAEEYGPDRLLEVARAHLGRPAAEVVDAVFTSLRAWSGGAPAQDDCTVVVVVYPAARR